MNEERWRGIDGWPYEVSDHGRVRRTTGGQGAVAGYVLSPKPHGVVGKDDTRYQDVHLYQDGELGRFRIHNLVLEAFVGPRPEGHEADHINGLRDDNRPANLRWLPVAVNRATNTEGGESHPGAKLTEGEAREVRRRARRGVEAVYAIAEEFGVSRQTVSDIKAGRSWACLDGGAAA